MNELTPTEISFINEVNTLTMQIACAREHEVNHAGVHFFGRIGGDGGTISFMINGKRNCGEFDFRTKEECLERLRVLLAAVHARRL